MSLGIDYLQEKMEEKEKSWPAIMRIWGEEIQRQNY